MLWRDLAGRLRVMTGWASGHSKGVEVPPDSEVLKELKRLYFDATGLKEGSPDPRPTRGPGGISWDEAAIVRPNPKLTDQGAPPRRDEGGG